MANLDEPDELGEFVLDRGPWTVAVSWADSKCCRITISASETELFSTNVAGKC